MVSEDGVRLDGVEGRVRVTESSGLGSTRTPHTIEGNTGVDGVQT